MKLANLRIGRRLGLGFGLLLLLMLVGNGVAIVQFTAVGAVNNRIIEKDWVKSEAATTINATAQANAKRTLELLVSSRPEQQAQIRQAIAKNKKTIDEALQTLEQMVYLPEGGNCWRRSRKSAANMSSHLPGWQTWLARTGVKTQCN